jgi:hypothetical protein
MRSRQSAIVLGIVGGLACLVRITSLSFLLPGFVWLLATGGGSWKTRAPDFALGGAIMAVVISPFLIACWHRYGDPLYAINAHTTVYRAAVGENAREAQSAATYLADKWRTRPMNALHTFAHGMTAYPFLNKWTGFSRWFGWLGPVLSVGAIIGLLGFAATAAGRLLLVVLTASLLPYSMTWRIGADWRFTEHAYPFFLVAAAASVGLVFGACRLLMPAGRQALTARRLATAGAVGAAVLAGVWLVRTVLPLRVAAEHLKHGEDVTIFADGRGRPFWGDGWSRQFGGGNVIMRASMASAVEVRVPLPVVKAYELTLRLDPFPRPLDPVEPVIVDVSLNGRALATLRVLWQAERVGAYEVVVPATVVIPGETNWLVLRPQSARRISLWVLRVRPRGA